MTGNDAPAALTVTVENLGGIESCQQTVDRGVTILTGPNATNRTSLLRSIGAALGGSTGTLKTDAEAGSVAVEFDDQEYTRTFEREAGTVRTAGEPYVDDADLVDQFSALLADNPARAAVERGDGDALRECIMSPVDTADIEATIERKQRAVRSLRDDLDDAKAQRERLPDLEATLSDHEAQLEAVQAELDEVRASVEQFEADADDAQAAETVVEDLKDARDEYERVRNRLETQRDALASLREEREAVDAELADTSVPETDQDRLAEEVERLQRRERDLETTITNLLSIVEFNEGLVADDGIPNVDDPDDDFLEQLDPGTQSVQCWTCGTRVQRQAIDDRLDDLREVIAEKRRTRNELRSEIEERRSDLEAVRSVQEDREALTEKLEAVDAEIAERESRIETLEERTAGCRDLIDDLESEAAEADDLRDSDLLEQYQRLSELEYERGQLEEQIDSVSDRIETVEAEAQRVEDIAADLDERQAELTTARNRIEDLERRAVETFNEHMADVLDLLGYENVERVWIERKSDATSSTSGVPESTFDLHVVRSTPDGAVYEDSVDHLSESEREVIGLVVALAGFLVHDVHETVPVVVLDSLEAIDADRIAALVDYFADFVPYLVVALLPEDAAALPDRYDRIPMGQAPA